MVDGTRHRFIILTQEEANRVHGETVPGHRLEPRQTRDGRFVLNERVVCDPSHARHIPLLLTLPRGNIVVHEADDGEQVIEIVSSSVVIVENSPRVYTPRQNAWDRPDLPLEGEWNEAALFEAVGRASTAWESFERSLMLTYTSILSPAADYLPIERAYGAIISFTSRLSMITAAAEARGHQNESDSEWKVDLEAFLKRAQKFSARRNEIVHGIVKQYQSPAGPISGILLLPSEYSVKGNKIQNESSSSKRRARVVRSPVYAYGCAEILYFRDQFYDLSRTASALNRRIGRVFRTD